MIFDYLVYEGHSSTFYGSVSCPAPDERTARAIVLDHLLRETNDNLGGRLTIPFHLMPPVWVAERSHRNATAERNGV